MSDTDKTNEKRTVDILCNNLNGLLNEENLSMRRLSLNIGASGSYIQKLMTDQSTPSLKKVDSISDYFGLDTWTLFCDFDEAAQDSMAILQMHNRLSDSERAKAKEHMRFLLKQYEEFNKNPQPKGKSKKTNTKSSKSS